jgi:hypothetical protein
VEIIKHVERQQLLEKKTPKRRKTRWLVEIFFWHEGILQLTDPDKATHSSNLELSEIAEGL